MADAVSFDKASLAWTLPWDEDWVTSVAFLGGTRKVAAGNNVGQILLWDLPDKPGGNTPAPIRKLDGHTNVVSRLLSSSNGRWLISASYDHTIRFWDMQAPTTGEATLVLNARTRDDLVRRRSSKVPAPIEVKVGIQPATATLTDHREWIQGMDLTRDGGSLLTGDDAGEVLLWELSVGKLPQAPQKRFKVTGWAYAVAIAPDKRQALVSERLPLVFDSGRHAGVKLWDLTKGEVQRDLSADYKGLHLSAAAYSPDGKLLALGRGGEADGNNGKVFLVDPASGKKLRELTPGHQYGVTDLAFHPDGKHLISAGRDTLIRIWEPQSGKLVKELGKARGGQFKDWVCAVANSADGRWLAAADMAGAVQVWAF